MPVEPVPGEQLLRLAVEPPEFAVRVLVETVAEVTDPPGAPGQVQSLAFTPPTGVVEALRAETAPLAAPAPAPIWLAARQAQPAGREGTVRQDVRAHSPGRSRGRGLVRAGREGRSQHMSAPNPRPNGTNHCLGGRSRAHAEAARTACGHSAPNANGFHGESVTYRGR